MAAKGMAHMKSVEKSFFNNLYRSYSIFLPFEKSMDAIYRPISGVVFAKEQIQQNQRAKGNFI